MQVRLESERITREQAALDSRRSANSRALTHTTPVAVDVLQLEFKAPAQPSPVLSLTQVACLPAPVSPVQESKRVTREAKDVIFPYVCRDVLSRRHDISTFLSNNLDIAHNISMTPNLCADMFVSLCEEAMILSGVSQIDLADDVD